MALNTSLLLQLWTVNPPFSKALQCNLSIVLCTHLNMNTNLLLVWDQKMKTGNAIFPWHRDCLPLGGNQGRSKFKWVLVQNFEVNNNVIPELPSYHFFCLLQSQMLKFSSMAPDLDRLNELGYRLPLNDKEIKRMQNLNRHWSLISSQTTERFRWG